MAIDTGLQRKFYLWWRGDTTPGYSALGACAASFVATLVTMTGVAYCRLLIQLTMVSEGVT